MKKGQLTYLFFIIMSVFLFAACNENELDPMDNSNTGKSGVNSSDEDRPYVFGVKSTSKGKMTKAVAPLNYRWEVGQTIRISFFGDNWDANAMDLVKQTAAEWLEYANLNFEYVGAGEESDVRIAFGHDGYNVSWSYIGTDCLEWDPELPTMNLIYFTPRQLENSAIRADFQAIILREFGHMIGLGFEHLNPDKNWIEDNIDDEDFSMRIMNYFYNQGWNFDEIEALFNVYYADYADYNSFDENSIMLLYFPPFLTEGQIPSKWNQSISEGDKQLVRKIYPPVMDIRDIVMEYNGQQYPYQAVRIGEYLWMNSNLYAPTGRAVTAAEIERGLTRIGVDPAQYPISPEDFMRYYGQYYDRSQADHIMANMKGYETNLSGVMEQTAWKTPSKADFNQLFGMCGNGTNIDVRKYLACKPGENPAAIAAPNLRWYEGVENIYGFNMMPGGGRFNGPNGNLGGAGDFNGLFDFARYIGADPVTISISAPHIHHTRYYVKMWHWLNIRFCRPLTDEELGYKLYYNNNTTSPDIKKLDLNATAPAGYTELPKGFLRGFYVQYILNKPNPEKTMLEILQLTTARENNEFGW